MAALNELVITGGGEPMLGAGNAFDKINTAIKALNEVSGQNTIGIKTMSIGNWNMSSTFNITIAHGLDYSKILGVQAFIINDLENSKTDLTTSQTNDSNRYPSGFISVSTTNIVLNREPTRFFDSTDYNSNVVNRGDIIIFYLK